DFGIAKVVEATRMTVTGGIVGTVDYMAPEQAEGRAIGAKTDIYSLGVLLYQMTTGRLPFKGETPSEVIQKHRFSLVEPPINFNPDMPENLSLVIEHMLEKEPAKRVASMRQLIKVLQKLKSQMHPSDPAKRPTVYNVEGFVTPPDRDTSVQAAPGAAPPSQPTPVPAPVAPPRRRWGRPSYQQAPDWASRLWLLLGILLILAIVSLLAHKVISLIVTRPLAASVLLEQGLDAERRGDYAGARAAYRGLATEYPDSAEAESALEGLRRITLMTQWGMFLKRYQLDVRDLKQMGRLDAAQDVLSFIERHWPEEKDWVERERTRLREIQRQRETRLNPHEGESP
ncbi:MAG: protein kinase, partial [Planctomycetes bacterium]|nr:protein kinase [Planctomycetota bacterium]